MFAQSAMTRDVYTVSPTDPLDEVYDAMRSLNIRHMPVLGEDDRLVGILSDRDVLLRALRCESDVVVPPEMVRDVMTADVFTCRSSTPISTIARVMVERKIDCVPVVDGRTLVGIVTSSDLLELLCSQNAATVGHTIPVSYRFRSWRPLSIGGL